MSQTKNCSRCKKTKEVSEFYKKPKTKDGLHSSCKQCTAEHNKAKNYQVDPEDLETKSKTCSKCNTEKLYKEFSKNKRCVDGLRPECKQCTAKYNKAKNYQVDPEDLETKSKTCTSCKTEKLYKEFSKNKGCSDGLAPSCKQCVAEQNQVGKFGLTIEELHTMYVVRENRCDICGTQRETLCIDHDHSLPMNDKASHRGLLCVNCNAGIGMLKDSPELLQKAINYLTDKL